jgi:hypothetical protein
MQAFAPMYVLFDSRPYASYISPELRPSVVAAFYPQLLSHF